MPDLESSRPTPNSGNSPGPHHGYDPDQPRVPSGHSDGGQWTKTPGGGTPAIARREAVVNHSKQESWVPTSTATGATARSPSSACSIATAAASSPSSTRPTSPETGMSATPSCSPKAKKFTFENSGNVQRIFDGEGNLVSATEWTEDGPRSVPIGQLAFSPL